MAATGTNILMITEAHFEAMEKSIIEKMMKAIESFKKPEAKEEVWINKKTAASMLSISLSTLNVWISENKLVAYRTGKKTIRLKKSEVLDSLKKIDIKK